MVSVTIYRFTAEVGALITPLLSALNLEHLAILHTRRPDESEVSIIPSSFFGQLAQSPHLQSLRMPFTHNHLRGTDMPIQFRSLISKPSFTMLRLVGVRSTRGVLQYATSIAWHRHDEHRFVLERLKVRSLPRLVDMQYVSLPIHSFKNVVENLTLLRIVVREWDADICDLSHCKSLRQFSVTMMEPVVLDLDSLPRGLDSMSLGIPPETEFAAVDGILQARITPNRFPHLKRLRLLRLQVGGAGAAFANVFDQVDAGLAIPLTATMCEERNIECVVWR